MALREETYQEIREKFIKHMEVSPPPYQIHLTLAYNLFKMTRDSLYDPMNTAYEIKDRLVAEFCPYLVQISEQFDIEKLEKIDDNRNFIYSIERQWFAPDVNGNNIGSYFLRISNETIPALLRLAYGNDL